MLLRAKTGTSIALSSDTYDRACRAPLLPLGTPNPGPPAAAGEAALTLPPLAGRAVELAGRVCWGDGVPEGVAHTLGEVRPKGVLHGAGGGAGAGGGDLRTGG